MSKQLDEAIELDEMCKRVEMMLPSGITLVGAQVLKASPDELAKLHHKIMRRFFKVIQDAEQ